MLRNAKFSYNNLAHTITRVSPFFALYSYHSRIEHFIKEGVPKSEVSLVRERGEEMMEMRKTLEEQLLSAIKY
jgi:hypothetical protein